VQTQTRRHTDFEICGAATVGPCRVPPTLDAQWSSADDGGAHGREHEGQLPITWTSFASKL